MDIVELLENLKVEAHQQSIIDAAVDEIDHLRQEVKYLNKQLDYRTLFNVQKAKSWDTKTVYIKINESCILKDLTDEQKEVLRNLSLLKMPLFLLKDNWRKNTISKLNHFFELSHKYGIENALQFWELGFKGAVEKIWDEPRDWKSQCNLGLKARNATNELYSKILEG
jgi:hypothetical protein